MQQSVVVIGLSRHTEVFGLPLPYMMAVTGLTVIPFFLTKLMSWLLTGLLWYVGARIVTALNPTAHLVAMTVLRRTPFALLSPKRVRRHV